METAMGLVARTGTFLLTVSAARAPKLITSLPKGRDALFLSLFFFLSGQQLELGTLFFISDLIFLNFVKPLRRPNTQVFYSFEREHLYFTRSKVTMFHPNKLNSTTLINKISPVSGGRRRQLYTPANVRILVWNQYLKKKNGINTFSLKTVFVGEIFLTTHKTIKATSNVPKIHCRVGLIQPHPSHESSSFPQMFTAHVQLP